MLHDMSRRPLNLMLYSLIILVKGHGRTICLLFACYLRLLIPLILESRQFCKPYRPGWHRKNIDLNVLSVTITDISAPADCH